MKSIFRKLISIIHYIISKISSLLEKLKIPPFFRNKIAVAVYLLIILFTVLMSIFSNDTNEMVPEFTVKKGNFLISITESGELKAKRSNMILAPRIRGELKITFLISEGQIVEAGDTVIKFDASEGLNKLREIEAQYELALSDKEKLIANQQSAEAQAESSLKSAKLSLELSKLNLNQMRFEAPAEQQKAKLQYQKDSLSFIQTLQEFESKKIIRKSEMARMQIEISQKRSNLEKAKKEIDDLTLTAPTRGLIVYEHNYRTDQKFQVGDAPWPGQSVITLPDLTDMESRTYVNEVDVSKIKNGQSVQVKLDAFQDTVFSGTISSVAKLGKKKNEESNVKTFDIIVDIKEHSEKLKPGMSTSNKIIVSKIPNVIFIPQEAVFEKENKHFVFIKNGSGYEERFVTTGEKSEDYIIIKKGLTEGDVIALKNPKEVVGNNDTAGSQIEIPANGK